MKKFLLKFGHIIVSAIVISFIDLDTISLITCWLLITFSNIMGYAEARFKDLDE